MNNALDRYRNGGGSLSPEKRRMNEALARIGQTEIETRAGGRRSGRLVFILDLTGSRRQALRRARVATAEMFAAVRRIGSVAVKLIYYRGRDEMKVSGWESDPDVLSRAMERLSCEGGETQIERALRSVLKLEKESVSGIVFIGDHCEEDGCDLDELAASLGKKRIPIFVFHECADDDGLSLDAKPIFKGMAKVSGGAYCEFQPDSALALRELLSTVAAFSAAGIEGVKQVPQVTTPEARQLQTRLLLLGPAGADEKP